MDILQVEKPILSAPMAGAAGPELVAAVYNAGGYGVIPLWGRSKDQVSAGIDELRGLTGRNFAVNLNLSFPYENQLDICIARGVHEVSSFWGGMEPSAIARAKAGGLIVVMSDGNAEEATIHGVYQNRILRASEADTQRSYDLCDVG